MLLGVVRVGVLIGPEGVRRLARQPVGDRVVRVGVLGRHGRRTHHDLGAVGAEQRDLLGAHLVGHDEDALVAALRGDDGESDAGVARRRLDDGATRPEEAVALGRVDHRDRGPVLDAATRVRGLDLGHEVARQVPPDPTEAEHRRVAHEVQDRAGDLGRSVGREVHVADRTARRVAMWLWVRSGPSSSTAWTPSRSPRSGPRCSGWGGLPGRRLGLPARGRARAPARGVPTSARGQGREEPAAPRRVGPRPRGRDRRRGGARRAGGSGGWCTSRPSRSR